MQGVFFRSNAKKCADSLGITGWVRNVSDGSVEALFEGEEDSVKNVIESCITRQPFAKVESREVEMLDATNEFEDFSIRYD